jgi:hypothetical protein
VVVWGRSGGVLLHVWYLCDALGGEHGLGVISLADTCSSHRYFPRWLFGLVICLM